MKTFERLKYDGLEATDFGSMLERNGEAQLGSRVILALSSGNRMAL